MRTSTYAKIILLIVSFCLLSLVVSAQSTDGELTVQADVIRNETLPSGNTKVRVANMFQAIIDSKVSLVGSYSNPTWITNLALSKITGITTFSSNLLTTPNPSAVRWIRINADNSISLRSAAETLSDIGSAVGTGTANELTYWSGTSTLGSLSTGTYPSLTELSYLKGATSNVQTQLGGKWSLSGTNTFTGTITNTGAYDVRFSNTSVSFDNNVIRVWNPLNTAKYTIAGGAITSDRTLTLPVVSGTRTILAGSGMQSGRVPISASNGEIIFDADFTYSTDILNTPTLYLSGTSTSAGKARFIEDTDDGTNYSEIKAGAQSANVTYTLPTGAPSISGQVLSSTTAGIMSWVDDSEGLSGTTGTVDNAILRADGTGGSTLKSSPVVIDDDGSTTFGLPSTTGTDRFFTVDGSNANINLYFTPKGEGDLFMQSSNAQYITGEVIQYESETTHDFKSTTSSTSATIRLAEGSANGSNYIGIKPANSITTNVTYTLPEAPSVSGQVLSSTTGGVMSWVAPSTGDVVGPASSTDNALARFDLTTGKLIQNSDLLVNDLSGNIINITSTSGNRLLIGSALGQITQLRGGSGDGSTQGGDLYLQGGVYNGFKAGNISLNFNSGSPINFQSGEQIIHINNSRTTPTGNPLDGIFLYPKDVSASSELFIMNEAGVEMRVGHLSGSHSQVGAATTVFTVTIGDTMGGTTYKVQVTPTNALSAALYYVTNKTTTTFDVTYLAGLTGSVGFDWTVVP